MSSKVAKNVLFSGILIVISLAIALVVAEIFFRVNDGYSLAHAHLVATKKQDKLQQQTESQASGIDIAARHLKEIPLAKGVKQQWFYENPPALPNRKAHPDDYLVKRKQSVAKFSSGGLGTNYVWNINFVLDKVCNNSKTYSEFFPSGLQDINVFKPLHYTPFPRFRYLSSVTSPAGLVTNQYGFRGRPISYDKPSKTIRIAFVGASTTVSAYAYPFVYPAFVTNWLNMWAKEQGLDVKFEAINAGRSGTNSDDFAAVVQNELVYLHPDIIFYYEGSNQFWPDKFIVMKHLKKHGKPADTLKMSTLAEYSAFMKRFDNLKQMVKYAGGKEPKKPNYYVEWPLKLDEYNPDIHYKNLPLQLPTILADMEQIRTTSEKNGIDFIPSSFVWLSYDGMTLKIPDNVYIYNYLNQSFWPYQYKWIRRMADFQNRVYKNYAKAHHLDFVDIAKYYPQDQDLFNDAIHAKYPGVRLRAWIVFQQLLPIVQEKIAKGELPKPATHAKQMDPVFLASVKSFNVTKQQVKDMCQHREKLYPVS